jgi:thiamine-monophosphate kinase
MKTTETELIGTIAGMFQAPSQNGPARRRKPARLNSLALGIGDDAALFSPTRGCETVLTCDWFLEGIHFLRDKHPADAVGWKCLARAASDIAAMGGQPRCFLLSLALPETHAGRWLRTFLGGLRRASRKLKCPLAGGDMTQHCQVLINITVLGEVRSGHALLRSGARPGDILYVSGRLGEADLGLQALRNSRGVGPNDPTLRKHFFPEPRIAIGRWLAESRFATAMMDLSDGLSTDLPRLCKASRVGARIHASRIPFARVPKWNQAKKVDVVSLALNGGDDYELLFTVSPHRARRVPHSYQDVALTAIGEITAERTLRLISRHGIETDLRPSGWDPFAKSSNAS